MLNEEKLYKSYFVFIYKFLYCLTHDKDIAEELTQDTFYKAIKKLNTYKGDSKVTVWLCEIAKNNWYDYCKKNYKFKMENIDNNLNLIISEQDIEREYVNKEDAKFIIDKINQLDELTKKVMYLRIEGELSFKEIGEILNKTEVWARVTFYRGKNKIKGDDDHE